MLSLLVGRQLSLLVGRQLLVQVARQLSLLVGRQLLLLVAKQLSLLVARQLLLQVARQLSLLVARQLLLQVARQLTLLVARQLLLQVGIQSKDTTTTEALSLFPIRNHERVSAPQTAFFLQLETGSFERSNNPEVSGCLNEKDHTHNNKKRVGGWRGMQALKVPHLTVTTQLCSVQLYVPEHKWPHVTDATHQSVSHPFHTSQPR